MRRQQQLDLSRGRLFFGDNLEVIRRHIADESVDLVYLDPPFNSNRNYNVLFRQRDGRKAAGQVKAFDDTWRWDVGTARQFQTVIAGGGAVARCLLGFRELLGTTDLLAYLTMMAPRLVELHRVLKPTGSLYLHCDPTASHYLKVVMDSIFGPGAYLNEITWKRTYTHGNASRNFGSVTDVLLFYAKSSKYIWNQPYVPFAEDYVRKRFSGSDPDGRKWQSVTLRNPSPRPNLHYEYVASNGVTYTPHPNGWAVGRDRMERYDTEGRLHFPKRPTGQLRVKQYLDETQGVRASNLWDDIFPINSRAAERLGYPTQKPLALLERIVATSSEPDGVVLDPFCGCGTAVDAAQRLGRRWIGIDITRVAIEIIQQRLVANHGQLVHTLGGEPTTVDDAAALAELDKHEFQNWVCRRLELPEASKKGADRGIDARYQGLLDDGTAWSGIVSVKGGAVTVAHLRDLRGTVEREGADFGLLVTLRSPTKAMRQESADAGFSSDGVQRLQVLTVEELLRGVRPQLPQSGALASAAKAESKPRRLRRAV